VQQLDDLEVWQEEAKKDVQDHVASVRDILYEDDWTADSNDIDTDGPIEKRWGHFVSNFQSIQKSYYPF
jgi:hypothetical protein